jgi:hypothetical protein
MPTSPTPSAIRPTISSTQPLLQVDADVRVGGQERRQGLGQEFGERIGVGQQLHLAGEAAGVGGEVLAHAGRLVEQGAGVLQQHAAGRGGLDALAGAGQQRGAEGGLHVADAGGCGGERQGAALGAGGDRAGVHHLTEQLQVDEIEAHPSPFAKGT